MGQAPVVIQLDERTRNPDGSFHVRVTYPDGVAYDVTVTDPASEDVESSSPGTSKNICATPSSTPTAEPKR